MSNFFQPLESRTLLSASSVSAADLAAVKALITADGSVLKADVNLLIAGDTAQTKVIATDFSALPRADRVYLTVLERDENVARAAFLRDASALINPVKALVSRSNALADVELVRAAVPQLAALAKDITALGTVTSTPLATLQGQVAGTIVPAARQAILTTFASDTTLVDDTTLEIDDSTADKAAISTAAGTFVNDVATLASDLTIVHTAADTYPDLVGAFVGTATGTIGKTRGTAVAITITFLSEDANGNVTATVPDLASGELDDVAGTVTLNGKIVLKGRTTAGGVLTILGQETGDTIVGTFSAPATRGKFSATELV